MAYEAFPCPFLLSRKKTPIHWRHNPISAGEMRESLLTMEAGAEHLHGKIECNSWPVYFRIGRGLFGGGRERSVEGVGWVCWMGGGGSVGVL